MQDLVIFVIDESFFITELMEYFFGLPSPHCLLFQHRFISLWLVVNFLSEVNLKCHEMFKIGTNEVLKLFPEILGDFYLREHLRIVDLALI